MNAVADSSRGPGCDSRRAVPSARAQEVGAGQVSVPVPVAVRVRSLVLVVPRRLGARPRVTRPLLLRGRFRHGRARLLLLGGDDGDKLGQTPRAARAAPQTRRVRRRAMRGALCGIVNPFAFASDEALAAPAGSRHVQVRVAPAKVHRVPRRYASALPQRRADPVEDRPRGSFPMMVMRTRREPLA